MTHGAFPIKVYSISICVFVWLPEAQPVIQVSCVEAEGSGGVESVAVVCVRLYSAALL